jgi:NAD+ kinase
MSERQRVLSCYHPGIAGAPDVAGRLAVQARDAGCDAEVVALPDPSDSDALAAFEAELDAATLLVCVGGDGTVLHAAALAATRSAAVFGVRMGRLGFLTETTEDEADEDFARVLRGEARTERHRLIRAQVGESPPMHALNDVVIGRATLGRTISVGARIDGVLIAEYRADAIVVSTATGSTGYALSVGGPILHPSSTGMILVPVAPHLTRPNPLVLPGDTRLRLTVERGYEAVMIVDGLALCPIESGMVVEVTQSERSVDFVRLGGPSRFYGHVAQRLGWLRQDHVLRDPAADDGESP